MKKLRVPLSNPKPDIQAFISAVTGKSAPERPPLVEYIVDAAVMKPVVTDVIGRKWVDADWGNRKQFEAWLDQFIEFWYRLGYDFVRLEMGLLGMGRSVTGDDQTMTAGKRGWSDEHSGSIASWQDFERFQWPEVRDEHFWPYEYVASRLPEGMGLISCHAAGVFEHVSAAFSIEGLCLALHDDPGLVKAVADRVGDLIAQYHRRLLQIPGLAAIFQGDDMGFRTQTLISPQHLRQYFLPWHTRYAQQAHAAGRPYFLHSCGCLEEIMEDLIADVGIDAKHSYENAIVPVTEMKGRYGNRIGILGGVDVDILGRSTPDQVRQEVRRLLRACAPGGRYAIGSGNSIPSYIPPQNYVAMVDEALGAGC